ncbi:MAG: DNA topoisomerase (ATP-hydrolyzing) subunit B [Anaerolineae bacterium]
MAKAKELNNQPTEQYDASKITVLEGLEAVRRRPGMYIGSTDIRGLHQLVFEVVDNAIDEALAGACDSVIIGIDSDNVVTVADNGRGIPVDIHAQTGKSGVEVVMTKLHAGAKFGSGGYKVASGLHGVGVSAVNALSDWLRVRVKRDGQIYEQKYKRGVPVTELTVVGKYPQGERTGATVSFLPDKQIFKQIDYKFDVLAQRFREMAFLTKGLTIKFTDEREDREMSFYFEGGISSFVRYLNRNRGVLHAPFTVSAPANGNYIEAAIQYTDSYSESVYTFANNINTIDGGTHMTGFRTALTRTLNDYARKASILKESDPNLTGDDVREGLTAIISVKLEEPQFESQTKGKLGNAEVKTQVEQVVGEAFAEWLAEHPKEGREIITKALTAARARDAARQARDLVIRKSALESISLPGKLADCSEKEPDKCELYIVEGDSAGGCFDGDTRVALADGRNLTFREIVAEQAAGKELYCYTIRQDGKIGLERIVNARVTRTQARVVKVTLDNGEELICTPDHPFMLRDGSYRPAALLTSADSLMPLRRRRSDVSEPGITIQGYEMAWDPRSETWLFTHILADWYNRWQGVYAVESGEHCHHVDFNKLNNNPTNIRRMGRAEHLRLHNAHLDKTLRRPDVIAKSRDIRQSVEFRAMMSERMSQPEIREMLSERAQAQWADAGYKAFMGDKWREFYNGDESYRDRNREQLDRAQKEYWADEAHREKQAERVREYFANHPEARAANAERAQAEWQDEALRDWRREKTREQWTPEFRAKRQQALDRTYYLKTIAALKQFERNPGELDLEGYQTYRLNLKDKTLLRFDTFCERYFDGDAGRAREAVANYNHRIVSVERLAEPVDVYDLEVPGTHNFALASGVFVHNSAKQGRDRKFQAILPLRGKIMNVEKSRLDKMLQNEEIRALITAIGTGVGNGFDIATLRYGRVILMSDADVDGAHIRTLLLTFFFRYMQPLIEHGHLYIAQPPLYKVKEGKTEQYVYDDKALEDLRKKNKSGKFDIQRYKGLGEMNPDQLWETTMNPENRTLLQVMVEDAAEADRTFDMLMGNEVAPRKRFIQTHAKNANLDV